MAGVVGAEGSGKSGTALSLCETVDPGFSADRVFFDPADFMEWCNQDARTAGDAAIIDEAGVGLGNRTWHDEDQILLNKALQTARDDNLAIFFTLRGCPSWTRRPAVGFGRLSSASTSKKAGM